MRMLSFKLESAESSVNKLRLVNVFNFKNAWLCDARVFPLISCSFHDSLPVRPLIDNSPSVAYGYSFIRVANVIECGIALRLTASGAAERAQADGTSAPGAFRSKAPAPFRP